MPRRQEVIAHSITYSVLHSEDRRKSFFARFSAFFYLYWLNFDCVREDLFRALRAEWQIDEDEYRYSFGEDGEDTAHLATMGDMGYSGSTFFRTNDSKYLVKSVPRRFEHTFFRDDLLLPYTEYVQKSPDSLLIRIAEFLQCNQSSIGSLCGLAPSHHIIMENLLYGKDESEAKGHQKWESWDLKPMSYFYPERDVAGGALSSAATKSKLADDFNDKVILTLDQAEEFRGQLEKDTALLANCNTVDYSLFLVRISCSDPTEGNAAHSESSAPPTRPSASTEDSPSWRVGLKSADGRYLYRAAILDFFWATHKVHAKAMTGLINTYNVVGNQGPMSVTTDSPEYRGRFLKMCSDIIETQPDEVHVVQGK